MRPLCPLPVLGALVTLVLCSCGTPAPATRAPAAPELSSPATSSAAPAPAPAPGTVAPPWLGTRVLAQAETGYVAPQPTPRGLRERRFTLPDTVAELPGDGFAADVVDPAPADVIDRSTWAPGCPVGRDQLAWLRVAFRGFDGARHTGELLVASSVGDDVVGVFRALWRADVPIEEMRITTKAEQVAEPTGDGNNTGAFVCRAVRGATTYSQHAYGLAIDVDPFQNPYQRQGDEGRVVLPELATAYLERTDVRPGMITPDGPVVRAFARVGWSWGGDYQNLRTTSTSASPAADQRVWVTAASLAPWPPCVAPCSCSCRPGSWP